MQNSSDPILYIFSGLPATGKTTLARMLGRHLGATHIRIDTIEQTLRRYGNNAVTREGYDIGYQLASDQLVLGQSVIADSCNPIIATRHAWQSIASQSNAEFINIEIQCSDPVAHRYRIENRQSDIHGLQLPSWEQVLSREYDRWVSIDVVVDTAGLSQEGAFQKLCQQLRIAES